MKQFIEIAELQQLSETGRTNLSKWWANLPLTDHREGIKVVNIGAFDLPRLSIGLMIEFLGEHNKYQLSNLLYALLDYENATEWREFDKSKFCDTLWEAVRDVVETP